MSLPTKVLYKEGAPTSPFGYKWIPIPAFRYHNVFLGQGKGASVHIFSEAVVLSVAIGLHPFIHHAATAFSMWLWQHCSIYSFSLAICSTTLTMARPVIMYMYYCLIKIFQCIIFWPTIPLSHCQGAWFCLRPHLYPNAALLLQDHPANVKEPWCSSLKTTPGRSCQLHGIFFWLRAIL